MLPEAFEERSDPNDLRLRNSKLLVLRRPTSLPTVQIVMILSLSTAASISAQVVSPFIVKLVEETGITDDNVQKLGYYTGLMSSASHIVKALTVLQWGRLSDRIGRRPVLLVGLLSQCIPTICFGLSRTFLAVVASNAMSGALYGNSIVVKTSLGDIADDTNVAQIYAALPLTWAIGDTVGPLIGGMLQHPYERFGRVFHRSEFWRTNPYFLPCGTAALIPAATFFAGLFLLKETAPFITRRSPPENSSMAHSIRIGSDDISVQPETPMLTEQSPLLRRADIRGTLCSWQTPPTLRTILTPRVLLVVMIHSILATVHMSFYNLRLLVLNTPISEGGLGLSPSFIGTCLAGFGIANGTVSALCFAPLTRKFGTKPLATACVASLIWCFALFPLMNALARPQAQLTPLVWAVFVLQLVLSTLPSMGASCILIYLRQVAPTSSALGATIGLAETTSSIVRSFGAVGAGSLFAMSIERDWLGGRLVYVVLCFFATVVTVATLLLPVKPPDREFGYVPNGN